MAFFTGKAKDHNHIDPLNMELYSRGQKWITDSGRYAYEPNAIQRKYVLSQRAHNTITPFVSRNVIQSRGHSRTLSALTTNPRAFKKVAESKTSSILSAPAQNLYGPRNEFLENNIDLLSSINSDVPDRERKLGILFDRINSIDDLGLKIQILEHLEGISSGFLQEKIFVMIAMCYMDINNNLAAKAYLDKIIELESDSEYYDIAIQLIGTLDVGDNIELNWPSLPDSIETDRQTVNQPVDNQERLVIAGAETDDKRMESDLFSQPLIHNESQPDILTWISNKNFDYLEGFFRYNSTFSHSRALLFVKASLFYHSR